MGKRLALLLLVGVAAACTISPVIVPHTPEAQQCASDCLVRASQCFGGQMSCAQMQHDCLIKCPGAYEEGTSPDAPASSGADPASSGADPAANGGGEAVDPR